MSARPVCTVVIPTYNRLGHLRRTLDALTRQDIGPDQFEVIVVDDGSTEPTSELVQRYADRLDVSYHYQPDEGFRAGAARNVGIAHARAEICVFIDAGVLPHSGCLRAYLRRHDEHRRAGVVGYVYCFNHNNEDAEQMLSSLDFSDVDGTIAALDKQRRWLDVREKFYSRYAEPLHELPAPWLMFWTCNASARTDQLRALGGFDEAFRTWGGEDVDLGYRLHLDGAQIVLDRAAAALHYPHEKSKEKNAESLIKNFQYFVEKFDTPITRLLLDPSILYFDINDVIRERGLPSCAEYLASRQTT